MAAKRFGACTSAEAECRSPVPILPPALDFSASGVVGGSYYHASVLGAPSATTRANWDSVPCSLACHICGRCCPPAPACCCNVAWEREASIWTEDCADEPPGLPDRRL